jgi:hypothetical protein
MVNYRRIKKLFVIVLIFAWLMNGWPPIWLNPRFPPEPQLAHAAIDSGIIVAWPSTAGSIPAGWTRVTALDSKFARSVPNSSTDPGTTGGAATHTHTTQNHNHTLAHTHASVTSSGPTGAAGFAVSSTQDLDTTAHTHTTNAVASSISVSGDAAPSTNGTTANDPAYLNVIWIQSDGSPTGVPSNALAMFNSASLPTSWTIYTNSQNRYLRGAVAAGNGGATSGSSTHSHAADLSHTHSSEHVHPDGTVAQSAATNNSFPAGAAGAGDNHTHSYTVASNNIGTSNAATINSSTDSLEPPFQKVAVIQNGTGGQDLPIGTIAVWRGTLASIPTNWVLADGNNSTPNLMGDFPKGALDTSELGNTGGATTHTHTSTAHSAAWTSSVHTHSLSITGTSSATRGINPTPGGTTGPTASHTHTATSGAAASFSPGTSAPNLDSTTSLPAYEEVAYIMYQGVPATPTPTNSPTPTPSPTPAAAASFTQNAYRWYVDNDAANPTDAWPANGVNLAENTAITLTPAAYDPPGITQELRLRVNLTVNTANLAISGKQFSLQFKAGTDGSCTTGSWTTITTGQAWQYATSSVTDGADITEVLSTTTAGKGEEYVKSDPSQTNHVGANTTEKIEYDFHLVGTSAATSTQYSFRVVENGGATLDGYTNCPTLTTEAGNLDLMRHGNVFSGNIEAGFTWAD